VLLLCCFVPYRPNFVPCSLWQILTLCHVYTVAFLRVSVFPRNFQVSEALWILCYFCAVLCRIRGILCHASYGRFWHMPCIHPSILAGLSVPKEFSRVGNTVNFVLLLCCFVPYRPNFVPCSLWQILTLCHVYTVAFLWVSVFPMNFQVSEALWILCYFCAVLYRIRRILCHAAYGRFWHMTCVHPGILAGLSVPKEFSRVWSTVNFVLLLCCFVQYRPNFEPCSLWQILTLCHVYTVAFLWVSVFPRNFQVSEALWILCYFCAVLCRIRRILCHAAYGTFWHMTCVHRDILAGLSVHKEFSRVWSTVNFVLLLCCFVPHTPNFVPRRLWEILTYAMCTPWHSGGSKCSQAIFTVLKLREFCATFVLFCAVYAEFCAMLLVADSGIMLCVHCCILVGLSVP